MKNISLRNLLIGFLIALCSSGYSQADSTKALYERFPDIPLFSMYKAQDSTLFTRDDLKKKKETIFIIFSPDCEHCQQETKNLIANIDKFKKAQIIMVTSLPYNQMKLFYDEFKIVNYPTITMGYDPTFFFHTFFNIKYLPVIFIYDKKGKFKKSFEGSVKIDKILESL
jgi:thiol-disulfide isomerase/thioredoxin